MTRPRENIEKDFIISWELVFGFLFGVGITVLFVVLNSPSYIHATTCEEIDDFLERDLIGNIELDDVNYDSLMRAMEWCMEKGYEPKPLTGLRDLWVNEGFRVSNWTDYVVNTNTTVQQESNPT
jgi:hypothetical protein